MIVHRRGLAAPHALAVVVLAALLPFWPYVEVAGVSVFSGYLVIVAGLASLVVLEGRLRSTALMPAFVLLGLGLLLGGMNAVVLSEHVISSLHLLLGGAAFVLVTSSMAGAEAGRRLRAALLWPAPVVAVIGIVQWVAFNVLGLRELAMWWFSSGTGAVLWGHRTAELFRNQEISGVLGSWTKSGSFWGEVAATSVFPLPSIHATFSAVYLLLHWFGHSKPTAWDWGVRGLLAANLVLSQSRTAWAALGVVGGSLLVVKLVRHRWPLRIRLTLTPARAAALFLVVGIIVGAAQVTVRLDRLAGQVLSPLLAVVNSEIDTGTTRGRLAELRDAWTDFTERPLTGYGWDHLDTFGYHNEYARFAVGGGVLAAIAFVAIVLIPFGWAAGALRVLDTPMLGASVAGCAAAMAFLAVNSFGTARFENPRTALLFWLVAGLAYVACRATFPIAERQLPRRRAPEAAPG